ncbi:hypothetical protein ACO229_17270 [Promicromonospora sp. MS192]|uniref:hypothetical protein n=1 Tax=Promicromonospora sp. MS192 TaxID=3412684 RepID=UPI003C2B8BE4
MTFVSDATSTDPLGRFSAADILERTEAVLRDRFARIATVAELEAEDRASGGDAAGTRTEVAASAG